MPRTSPAVDDTVGVELGAVATDEALELASLLALAGATPFYRRHWGQTHPSGGSETRLQNVPVLRRDDLLLRDRSADIYGGRRTIAESSLLYLFTPQSFVLTPLAPVGEPTFYAGLTQDERAQLVDLLSRQWMDLGLCSGSTVVAMSWGNDPFVMGMVSAVGGMASYMGPAVEDMLGVSIVRLEIATQEAQRSRAVIELFRPQVVFSSAEHMLAVQQRPDGRSLREFGVEAVVLREGRPLPQATRGELETAWKVPVLQLLEVWEAFFYAQECRARSGYHIARDLYTVEITDEAGRAQADAAIGFLTVTPRFLRGMPMVRYQSTLRGRIDHAQCECGSCMPRFVAANV
jgi:hypothetical protein